MVTNAPAPPSIEDQFPVRTSARKAFNTCEWAWERSYVENLKPHVTKPAFRFGTLVHSALEKFYRPGVKRGPHPAKTFQRLYKKDAEANSEFGVYSDEDWLKAEDLGVGVLKGYVDLYGKDTRYKVVATEQPFWQPVYETVLVAPYKRKIHEKNTGARKVKQRRYRFTYVGVLDGIWYDTQENRLLLVDHKTAASIEQLMKKLDLDMQSTAYWTWGVDWLYDNGYLKRKDKLDGLLFNMMRKALPDDDKPRDPQGRILNRPKRPVLVQFYDDNGIDRNVSTIEDMISDLTAKGHQPLQLGEPSKRQPAELFKRHPIFRGEAEREYARHTALQDHRQMMTIINGERPARKMYPDGPFGCTSCSYKDICELHETGSDWESMQDATMVVWDPYAEHEVYDAR